jgi:outer membrane lipoprotein carrier protein
MWLKLCLSVLLITPGIVRASAEQLESWLDLLASVEGKFSQQVNDSSGREIQTSAGHFSIQRPGKFRWHYQQPYQQLIVSNGQTLYIYDKDLEQVTVKDLQQEGVDLPALLLSHKGRIADSFYIDTLPAQGAAQRFILKPKGQDTPFAEIEIEFNQTQLSRMILRDHLDQSTRIEFQNVIRNPDLPKQYFDFKIPDGVDVIEQF